MTQDLIWEQYSCPAASKELLWGNSAEVSYKANAAEKIDPPSPPTDDVLINKTGSTNGFGTYVAFVPAKKTGVVLLANKRYPNECPSDPDPGNLEGANKVRIKKRRVPIKKLSPVFCTS